ncbi:MAG: DUF2141 domain-containing protein [Flavobacteriaceae bacterium]|nr:DUF2141 domain-containing protein [Flavobacteriaceae bacterium]
MVQIAKILILILLSSFSLLAQETSTAKVRVEISNFKTDTGTVMVGLYASETNFLNKGFKQQMVKVENGQAIVVFENLPEGTYAIGVYHDENENGKLDTNFMGIPKERTGTSNNASSVWGPPKWKDAKFDLKKERHFKIKLS